MKKISILTTLMLFVLTVQAQEVIKGDADGTDVSLMIEYIMGEWVEGFSERNADVNKDQNIDAADLVRIINIINENNKQ